MTEWQCSRRCSSNVLLLQNITDDGMQIKIIMVIYHGRNTRPDGRERHEAVADPDQQPWLVVVLHLLSRTRTIRDCVGSPNGRKDATDRQRLEIQ